VSPSRRISVVIADDHPIYREGLARALSMSGRFDISEECSDGENALRAMRLHRPSVALIDYQLPVYDGITLAALATKEGLASRVLLISAVEPGELAQAAMQEGAAGWLSKETGRTQVLDALETVHRGGTVTPACTSHEPCTDGRRGEFGQTAGRGGEKLSDREFQVIEAFARGLSIPLVAGELCIAPDTVKTHVRRIYRKLCVGDRAAAVAEAMRRGLLT
jgi:two-component system nitrate/nitrite response regulator NarL